MNRHTLNLFMLLAMLFGLLPSTAVASPVTSIVLGGDPARCGPVSHPDRTDPYVDVYLPCPGTQPPVNPGPVSQPRKNNECSFAIGLSQKISVLRGNTYLRTFDNHRDASKYLQQLVAKGSCRQARPTNHCSVDLNRTPWADSETSYIVKVGMSFFYSYPADRDPGKARANAVAVMNEMVRSGVCLAPGAAFPSKRAESTDENEEAAAL